MHLFIALDNCIVKYKVNFNREKVLKIKKDILENCVHFKNRRITTSVPEAFEIDDKYIINSKVGTGINPKLYSLNYYEIVYPNIIKLIDRLLNGDATSVIEIEAYKDEREDIKNKIDKTFDEFYKIDSTDKKSLKYKINEINYLIEEAGINEHERKVDEYVNELIDSIKLTEMDRISIRKANLYFDFFGDEVKESFVRKLV